MNTILKLLTENVSLECIPPKSFKNELEIDISNQKPRKFAVNSCALKEILKRVLQVGGTRSQNPRNGGKNEKQKKEQLCD